MNDHNIIPDSCYIFIFITIYHIQIEFWVGIQSAYVSMMKLTTRLFSNRVPGYSYIGQCRNFLKTEELNVYNFF